MRTANLGRPAGEVRLKLMVALRDAGRALTLREWAGAAHIDIAVVRRQMTNLQRSQVVVITGERRVDYRNRPVSEYSLAARGGQARVAAVFVDPLREALAAWG